MLAVLHRRNFALLWCGQLVFRIGQWVLWIGLPFYVYERTGSALATGTMLIISTLPPDLVAASAVVSGCGYCRQQTTAKLLDVGSCLWSHHRLELAA